MVSEIKIIVPAQVSVKVVYCPNFEGLFVSCTFARQE